MDIHKVPVDGITVGSRRRPIDSEKVERIAESMKSLGLQTPISVFATGDDGSEAELIAGAHRLEAARKLGWEEIECRVHYMNDIDRQRWEIAENLHRAELTKLERDEHIAEWIRLTEEAKKRQIEKPAQLAQVSKGGRGKKSGLSQASRELGINRDDVRRAVKVAGLTDEAKQLAIEAGLENNRTALLGAAAAAPEEQADHIRRYARRKAVIKEARERRRASPKGQCEQIRILLKEAGSFAGRAQKRIDDAYQMMEAMGMEAAEGIEITELRQAVSKLYAWVPDPEAQPAPFSLSGEISLEDAQRRISEYWEAQRERHKNDDEPEEPECFVIDGELG